MKKQNVHTNNFILYFPEQTVVDRAKNVAVIIIRRGRNKNSANVTGDHILFTICPKLLYILFLYQLIPHVVIVYYDLCGVLCTG